MTTNDTQPDDTGMLGLVHMFSWALTFGAVLGGILSAVHFIA